MAEKGSNEGHNLVTGTATLQPGAFHEPGGESRVTSGGVTGQVEEMASQVGSTLTDTWESMTECMSRYPVAVFLTGIGLGVVLDRFFLSGSRWRWRS
jgi:hypothetical protein